MNLEFLEPMFFFLLGIDIIGIILTTLTWNIWWLLFCAPFLCFFIGLLVLIPFFIMMQNKKKHDEGEKHPIM